MKKIKIVQSITNKQEKSIERYFLDIDKFSSLTHEEEIICAQGIRAGDKKSLEKLISCNLRFVISVAKQYQNSALPLSDLINSGNEGLVVAAHKFDETKGFKFISYAVWWIRQSIIKSIMDNARPVRLSSNKSLLLTKYKKLEESYVQKHGEYPSVEFVMENLEIDYTHAEEIINLSKFKFSSLDAKIDGKVDETSESYADMLEDKNSLNMVERVTNLESLRKDLLKCISILGEKEKFVLTKVYNLDGNGEISLEKIGECLNLSKERIRQLRDYAIYKISSSKVKKILFNHV